MIKLKSVRHTGVPVMDVDKAREFYGKILGFKEIPRPEIKGIPAEWGTVIEAINCQPL